MHRKRKILHPKEKMCTPSFWLISFLLGAKFFFSVAIFFFQNGQNQKEKFCTKKKEKAPKEIKCAKRKILHFQINRPLIWVCTEYFLGTIGFDTFFSPERTAGMQLLKSAVVPSGSKQEVHQTFSQLQDKGIKSVPFILGFRLPSRLPQRF